MKKLYACPDCKSGNVTFDDMGFMDESGQYFESRETGSCYECGHSDFASEFFIGYEDQPDDNPNDDIPFGNPDLNEISGGYDA